MSNCGVIEIPLKDNEAVIEISKGQLPAVGESLPILRQECCRLSVWIELALEYYRQGKHDAFVEIMEASRTDASLDYENSSRDQMVALDSLAAFYVQKGSREKQRDVRKALFGQATLLYTTADKIDIYDTNHLLGRAYLCLLEGDKIDQAEGQFSYVLNQIPTSVPAILGRASTAFLRKDYDMALSLYRRALKLCPTCPEDVRIGIGTCLVRLNRLSQARALQMNPNSIGALVGLAVLDINGHDAPSIRSGIQRLTQAYSIDSANPVVLNHLAEHFFFRKDFQRVKQLALHAFHNTDNEIIKAESCYQLARTFHCENDYAQAFQYYYQSTQFASPNFVLPHYGLGQMYLQRNDIANAAICFKKVLAVHPDSYESMRVLGRILSDSSNVDDRELAVEYLEKCVKQYPQDIDSWIDLAPLLETQRPSDSLNAYKNAVDLMKANKDGEISSELYNNIGCLHQQLNNFPEALRSYKLALKVARSQRKRSRIAAGNVVTISYNIGLLYEATSQFLRAEQMYKKLIASYPNYVDAALRLGCMARDRGQVYEASDWLKDALQYDQQNANAWSLYGNLHMAKEEWRLAQRKYERILEGKSKDSYAMVAMGNIWLNMLFQPGRERDKDKRYQTRAITIYRSVLTSDPGNIWAVNGIACVLAHKKYFNEARDLFAQVRETTADFKDVWLNIAHIYVEQGQYHAAVRMYADVAVNGRNGLFTATLRYESCYQKFFSKAHNPEVLIYLSRALFRGGQYKEALLQLLNARRVWPDEPLLQFNIALVQQQMSVAVLQDQRSSLEFVLKAVKDLTTAMRTFRTLWRNEQQLVESSKVEGGGRVSRDSVGALASQQEQKCADLLSQARYHVERARQADAKERELRRQQEEKRREQLEQSERIEQERQKELDLMRQEQKTRRLEYLSKYGNLLTSEAFEATTSGSRKRGGGASTSKSANNDEIIDDEIVMADSGDYSQPAGEAAVRKLNKRKRLRKERQERRRKRRGQLKTSTGPMTKSKRAKLSQGDNKISSAASSASDLITQNPTEDKRYYSADEESLGPTRKPLRRGQVVNTQNECRFKSKAFITSSSSEGEGDIASVRQQPVEEPKLLGCANSSAKPLMFAETDESDFSQVEDINSQKASDS